ncbi:unnamed protein product [Orchesella dallaii]|uniref:N-acetyltransferase domain-containing protein n=1 Tax=Orchesella dallaii TaxID=48710 RepID=A0ABP1QV48_9HEXA
MASSSSPPNHVIREALTDPEILSCYPVIKELRPHITSPTELLTRVKLQQQNDRFHLMYIADTTPDSPDTPITVSILGYRINNKLFYGKELYVDDLCTYSLGAKKKGYGGALLDWAIAKGKEEKCDVVTLDSGYTRSDAHRLYLNKKFTMKCHHFCYEITTQK